MIGEKGSLSKPVLISKNHNILVVLVNGAVLIIYRIAGNFRGQADLHEMLT